MKYGRATTDLHAKSNMHHQANIAIQTNVYTSYSGTEAKQKYSYKNTTTCVKNEWKTVHECTSYRRMPILVYVLFCDMFSLVFKIALVVHSPLADRT